MATPWLHRFLPVLCFLAIISFSDGKLPGMLYTRDSETRGLRRLDGMWNFLADYSPSRDESFQKKWYSKPLKQSGPAIPMPVPSSYNDIGTDRKLRDFVGWAWYDREFYVDRKWMDERIVLRIDSAHYYAIVWINGIEAMRHDGGHLPFEADVTSVLSMNDVNRVTVAINNTLSPTTLPPGTIEYKNNPNRYPPGYFVQNLQMDFFNYAGIHRHVTLYTTPKTFIEDIDITTDIQGSNGVVSYTIYEGGQLGYLTTLVEMVDRDGNVVASSNEKTGTLTVNNANFWWPHTMNASVPGYMYTLQVTLKSPAVPKFDVYRQPFGIRTVKVTNTQLLINGKPFYCQGVNKHEDSDIRGKGLDYPLIARDFAMMKWLGVNCFRTSHYPYAEEILDQADQLGFVVIDESPGVGIGKTGKKRKKGNLKSNDAARSANKRIEVRPLKRNRKRACADRNIKRRRKQACTAEQIKKRRQRDIVKDLDRDDNFGNKSLAHHMSVMSEMYQRDKNRPGVIMWSVANEPASNKQVAGPYFKAVIEHVRSLDSTRPVTFVCNQEYNTDQAVQYVDIILINRYYAWYSDNGHTELIQMQLEYDARQWHNTYNKALIVSEYGADTIAGFHQEPSFVFTEEYQVEFLQEYHKAFDTLRQEFLVGEMPWNFADFMTVEGITRVVGNKKGLLTRQRQPKMSGHLIRDRYMSLTTGKQNLCRI